MLKGPADKEVRKHEGISAEVETVLVSKLHFVFILLVSFLTY